VPGQCVIGLQWGDEAKGKLVDLLTEGKDLVVRYQGGANAGHTVVIGDDVYKLHHIPSGILNEGVLNLISPGVVINPPTILQEIEMLADRGIDVAKRMKISQRAHVVMPWHVLEDKMWNELVSGKDNIGTTLRGIGPCYADKIGRSFAIRMGDMIQADFAERVAKIVAVKTKILSAASGCSPDLDADAIVEEYSQYAEKLKPMISDTNRIVLDAVDEDKNVLFEGAQGSLLDIAPGNWLSKVIGVTKSYATRVGGGPFPTEQDNEKGQHIRDLGNEYGTTTGRPRRCGWWDAVAARYTARLGGVTSVALTMLDVLSELEEIEICVAYELNGERITHFPGQVNDLRNVKPIYETISGWQTDVTGARSLDDLPTKAIQFARKIETLIGRPIEFISVGPDRAQTIHIPETDSLENYLKAKTV